MMSHLAPWRAVSAARKGARVAARLPQARRRMAGPPMCPPGAMSGALGPDGAAVSIDTARVSIATELAGEGSDNTNSFCESVLAYACSGRQQALAGAVRAFAPLSCAQQGSLSSRSRRFTFTGYHEPLTVLSPSLLLLR
jgi:hypothetical protein